MVSTLSSLDCITYHSETLLLIVFAFTIRESKPNVFGTLKLVRLFWDTFLVQKAPQLSRALNLLY